MTSSAEAPIEPVAPSTATLRIVACPDISEPEPGLAQGEHGQGGDHAVDAVQDAAVARDQVARIFGPDMALEQAFEQVADHREPGREQGDHGHQRQLRSEEHTSAIQSLMRFSYADFCLKKTNVTHVQPHPN